MVNRLLDIANLLIGLAALVSAPASLAGAGGAVGALQSLRALRTSPNPDLAREIAGRMAAVLDMPEVTDDQRKLIPQMIEAALPPPAQIVGARLDAKALIAGMEASLTQTEHDCPGNRALFRSVLEAPLARLLEDPDFVNTLAPAFMRDMLEGQDRIEGVAQAGLAQGRRVEEKLDRLPRQFAAILEDLKAASRAELITVADRFEIPGAEELSDTALRRELEKRAEDWQRLRAEIAEIPEGMRQLANLKGAAQAAFEGGRFDEVEELLARVHEVELEEAARTAELRAETALLRGDVERAYLLLSSAADSLAPLDPLEPARRRILRYVKVLHDYGRRHGSTGLQRGQDLLAPVLTEGLRQTDAWLWAAGKNAQAIGFSTLGKASGGVFGADLMKKSVSTYREVLQVHTRSRAPQDWVAAKTNLGSTLTALAQQTPGTPGLSILREAVDVLFGALKECEKQKDPQGTLVTLQSLGNALRLQGERIKGPKGVALLVRSARVFEWALESQQIMSAEERAAGQMNTIAPLLLLGTRVPGSSGADYLDKAIRAAHGALDVFSRQNHPISWAETQVCMAFAHLHHATHNTCTDPAPHLRAALAHVEAALEVFDPAHMQYNHQKATALRDELQARLGA